MKIKPQNKIVRQFVERGCLIYNINNNALIVQ